MTSLLPGFSFESYRRTTFQRIEERGDIPLERFLEENNLTEKDLAYAGVSYPDDKIIHIELVPTGMGTFYYINGDSLSMAEELAAFVRSYHGTPLPPKIDENDVYEEDDDLDEDDEEALHYQASFAEFKRKQASGELLSEPKSQFQAPTTQPSNRLDYHASYPESEYKFAQLLPVAAFSLPLGLGSLPLLSRGGDDTIWAGVLIIVFLYSPVRYLTRKDQSTAGGRTISLVIASAIFWFCLFVIAKLGGNSSSTCWYLAGCI